MLTVWTFGGRPHFQRAAVPWLRGFALAIAALTAVVFVGHYGGTAATPATAAQGVSGPGQSAAASAAAPQHTSTVSWRMYADSNKKVKGPDANWHDAMVPGNPTVQ